MMTRSTAAFVILCIVAGPGAVHADASADRAAGILEATDFRGGLIVHVGCSDGQLTAALGARSGRVVHGLDTDTERVEAARQHIREAGLYGKVSVDKFDGQHLPYTDNLVNLLVVSGPTTVDKEELLRVLVPGGVLVKDEVVRTKDESGGTKDEGGATIALQPSASSLQPLKKPWPEEIDHWPHYLYGPDNNAVARDSVVGPPQHMQWVDGPTYARSHEINSSMAAMVSSGGRLFYIWDEGPTGMTDDRFPAHWSLIAKDAFNGTTFWKRPMPQWGWRQWHDASRWDDPRERAKMLRHLPPTSPRRLVAVEDRLYVTLGYQAAVSELDATTGDVLREFEGTGWTDEILYSDGLLLLRVRSADSPPDTDVWDVMPLKQHGRVVAVDAQRGRVVWQSEPEPMAPLTLATSGDRVFYANYERVVCLDRESGRELWRGPQIEGGTGHRGTGGTLVAQDRVVLYAHAPASGRNYFGQLDAFSADTGQLLWRGPTYAGPGVANAPDLFVVDDLVWVGETRLPVDNSQTELRRQGFDPLSGEVVREVTVPKLTSPGHHYRCYRSKATERYLLLPKRGVEFVDLQGENHMRNDWLRAPCIYGMLPCNGLLYVAPHQCVCYPGVQLASFNALAAKISTKYEERSTKQEERLTKGPEYHEVSLRPSSLPLRPSSDWPAYRQDARRSGSAHTQVPDGLDEKWRLQIGGNLTPPVVADGRLLVADKDAHTVHALDADSGRQLWSYTAGGRVDSPPTVCGSLVLFGSADGRAYCLRVGDGREVWRFLAAPYDRRVAAFEQVESVWPVHGSVLVQQDTTVDPPRDVAYFTAGRSSFLDGGIHVYGLDPQTGQLLHHTCLSGPRPDPSEDTGMAGYMDGAKSDLLVSDGTDLYLYQERFRSDLTRVPAPMQNMGKESGGFRIYPSFPERGSSGKRLITTSGFLDSAYNEGHYWTYGERWAGWDRKMRTVPSYGQLLVFDERTVYGVHVFTDSIRVRRGMRLGDKGYRLFARDHDASEDRWSVYVPVRVRAMVSADDKLFIAGPPDIVPADDPLAAIEGRRGAVLRTVSASDGQKLAERKLDSPPVFDGLIAAHERLFLCATDGQVVCLGAKE